MCEPQRGSPSTVIPDMPEACFQHDARQVSADPGPRSESAKAPLLKLHMFLPRDHPVSSTLFMLGPGSRAGYAVSRPG